MAFVWHSFLCVLQILLLSFLRHSFSFVKTFSFRFYHIAPFPNSYIAVTDVKIFFYIFIFFFLFLLYALQYISHFRNGISVQNEPIAKRAIFFWLVLFELDQSVEKYFSLPPHNVIVLMRKKLRWHRVDIVCFEKRLYVKNKNKEGKTRKHEKDR